MPRGTRHIITGTLLPGIGQLFFLEIVGGGCWQLDMSRRHKKLIGHLVTVEGIRSGFDLLDVSSVIAVDGRPVRSQPMGWLNRLRSAFERIWSC